jgi:hypothetical protein
MNFLGHHTDFGIRFCLIVKVIAVRSLKDRRFEKFSVDTIFTMTFVSVLVGFLGFQAALSKNTRTDEGQLDVSSMDMLIGWQSKHGVLV